MLGDVRALTKPMDHEYSKQVALIRAIKKAVMDLTTLEAKSTINNVTALNSLESMLPPKVFNRWKLKLHDAI